MSAIISLLVDYGANIDAKSLNGSTPLHSAAVCLAKGSIGLLFDLRSNYLSADKKGMSALHYAIKDVKLKLLTKSTSLICMQGNRKI